jgi:hypothetical protein
MIPPRPVVIFPHSTTLEDHIEIGSGDENGQDLHEDDDGRFEIEDEAAADSHQMRRKSTSRPSSDAMSDDDLMQHPQTSRKSASTAQSLVASSMPRLSSGDRQSNSALRASLSLPQRQAQNEDMDAPTHRPSSKSSLTRYPQPIAAPPKRNATANSATTALNTTAQTTSTTTSTSLAPTANIPSNEFNSAKESGTFPIEWAPDNKTFKCRACSQVVKTKMGRNMSLVKRHFSHKKGVHDDWLKANPWFRPDNASTATETDASSRLNSTREDEVETETPNDNADGENQDDDIESTSSNEARRGSRS